MNTSILQHLIPNPLHSDLEDQRFHHRDVSDLPADKLWAEQVVLTESLARHILANERDRLIWAGGDQVTSREWVKTRLRALKAETTRRKGRAA